MHSPQQSYIVSEAEKQIENYNGVSHVIILNKR